jgi:hypothetical protein
VTSLPTTSTLRLAVAILARSGAAPWVAVICLVVLTGGICAQTTAPSASEESALVESAPRVDLVLEAASESRGSTCRTLGVVFALTASQTPWIQRAVVAATLPPIRAP